MRLDKLLANSGYGTRSEIKDFIRHGKVQINGVIIKDPGFKVNETDSIFLLGQSIDKKENLYFVFDKPVGVLTAMEDKRLPTIKDYIPANLMNKKLSPVGRLDYNTSGLLIITNDGELSHRLTSPKYNIPKIYRVKYDGPALDESHIKEAEEGIVLKDMEEEITLKSAKLTLLPDNYCELTLFEGKTHEVRRIISHWNRVVIDLRRIKLGPISLFEEKPGELIELTQDEISELKKATGL